VSVYTVGMSGPPDHEDVPPDYLFGPPRPRSSWLGRWLCRHGWHKWIQKTAVDRDESDDNGLVLVVTDYAWCTRPDCDEPTRTVGRESKRIE
jgi:hypothetical protein